MREFEGTNLIDFKEELLQDAKTREEYDRLKPKYDFIHVLIERRNQLRMSQKQLAEIIGMQQPAISRLENGGSNATIGTLLKVMNALDLEVEFKPRRLVKS